MASTTALFTGLSGLLSNSRQLDVIGNNIANVNTIGFKSSRMSFLPTFSRSLSMGTAPGSNTGGTNPGQVGLGVNVGGTQRNFANGAIGATGINTDMAIEGDGFFIVNMGGAQQYTRAGSFLRNENNDLVTQSGARVMGFAVDEQFNVIEGELVPLNIPVGTLTLAEATENIVFSGNLNASGEVGTTGSVHESRAFYLDAEGTIPVTGDEDLATTDIYVSDGAGGFNLAFDSSAIDDKIITINGIEKGGKDIGEVSFAFSSVPVEGVDDHGSTLNDFANFLDNILGIDGTNINGQSLGGSVSFNEMGQLVIVGNEGTAQELSIETADMIQSGRALGEAQPFAMTKTADAVGESIRTSFLVYDSLGTPLTVDVTMVLQEAKESGGTVWTFLAESADNDALERVVGNGTLEFDANGNFLTASNQAFSLTRTNGAVSPLTINMDFSTGGDFVSSLTDSSSNLAAVYQDGSAIGTLATFSVGQDGAIVGGFTNGLSRNIGQLVLAKFANPEGLVDTGDNMYVTGANSGDPLIARPLDFGSGRVLGGALELSNVDLSQEFINMIMASTGYSAASRVITTADELMNQLLLLGR
ncbi:MAG: hypothetical protein CMJ32_11600 [Phycisphaerae bacterium]|nr:hypothetical protein [Phycisphaerae bacterium]